MTGKLSYSEISDISDIQVKKLFVWFPVFTIEAHPNSGTDQFKVIFLSFSYSSKEFNHTPDCMKGVATVTGIEELLRDTETDVLSQRFTLGLHQRERRQRKIARQRRLRVHQFLRLNGRGRRSFIAEISSPLVAENFLRLWL
ncbi:hypothetical protein Cni_G16764 [Canna indica]|uniref:Uncharacterized protein n=1 Tax=Canna indica TaxID=4628 RepID=A0AAQ3KLE4_9LILI|nr:hypothetical protein Cni_G16764 [Canna indica]